MRVPIIDMVTDKDGEYERGGISSEWEGLLQEIVGKGDFGLICTGSFFKNN